jgi:hypothetical protein
MNNEQFTIDVHCVIFSTNIAFNQKFILSTDSKELKFPKFELTNANIKTIEDEIVKFAKSHVFVSDLQLLPQLINIHSNAFEHQDNHLNIIYGFIVEHTINIANSYWLEFDLLKPVPQSQLLYEVIQKLQ